MRLSHSTCRAVTLLSSPKPGKQTKFYSTHSFVKTNKKTSTIIVYTMHINQSYPIIPEKQRFPILLLVASTTSRFPENDSDL